MLVRWCENSTAQMWLHLTSVNVGSARTAQIMRTSISLTISFDVCSKWMECRRLKKLVLFGIDGGTFDVSKPLIDEGKLPNLAKVMC